MKYNLSSLFPSRKMLVVSLSLFSLISLSIILSKFLSNPSPNSHTITKEALTSTILPNLSIPFIDASGDGNNTRLVQVGDKKEEVAYYAKTFGGGVYVTKDGELVYDLPIGPEGKRLAFHETLLSDGNSMPKVKGINPSPTKVNYFIGNDPSKWRREIPTYNEIGILGIYKDIDVSLKAYGGKIEKIFYIKPGGDPKDIKIAIRGATKEGGIDTWIDKDGRLRLWPKDLPRQDDAGIHFTRPVAYQEVDGKRVDVDVSYMLISEEGSNHEAIYTFHVSDYDKTRPLVIDPLIASTFLGGSSNEYENFITISDGYVYVAGGTYSSDYPTDAYDTDYNGGGDVFISKLTPDLKTLVASTFLGGSSSEYENFITISDGYVYVAGETSSSDYPTTQDAYDTDYNGGSDAFISKLDLDLTRLVASTFLGGSNYDYAYSLTISDGYVYVAGYTYSSDYPTTEDAYDTSYNGGYSEAFISKLNTNLSWGYYLTVSREGEGSGGVVSSPGGIDCGDDCSEMYEDQYQVTLTAEADEVSEFTGWGEDCSSCGTNPNCSITMNGDKTCIAKFEQLSGGDNGGDNGGSGGGNGGGGGNNGGSGGGGGGGCSLIRR